MVNNEEMILETDKMLKDLKRNLKEATNQVKNTKRETTTVSMIVLQNNTIMIGAIDLIAHLVNTTAKD